MMVVNSVLVEKVEINSASDAMMEARRKTANTAPCTDHVGPGGCGKPLILDYRNICAGQHGRLCRAGAGGERAQCGQGVLEGCHREGILSAGAPSSAGLRDN